MTLSLCCHHNYDCDSLYIAITINEKVFLNPLQNLVGSVIRMLERVTVGNMVHVNKISVPKVTRNVNWGSQAA